ncbi:transcriptional regulator [Actinorhabdospora filicis]|uniref:Transcriptional regulator n=1 Tax=Actinorhabdospora filicis TaxID=1785913 RepID=A0A9W6SHZ8_9ACTN|nr:helix-turn-helix transcriptional regulator [Actinorhabdospora filicis]GLZ77470.1 transcriptional regulator [Actinorhabdospora filicis]
MLRGRAGEVGVLRGLVEGAVAGRGGALVVRGEAGVGKTALLDVVAGSDGVRVLRGAGVESEAALAYAGLQVVLREVLRRVPALPGRQASALRAAVRGEGEGEAFLVGASVLTLLGDVAEDGPVLVLVDDAHWLDRESADALVFAARRLGAERVAVVFATRGEGLGGLPEVRLGGLPDVVGAEVLMDVAPGLAASERRRLLRAAEGNPLALVELAGGDVRRVYDERLARLPEATRVILTVAAAEDTGDLGLVLEAAVRVGRAVAEDLAPAEAAGLVRVVGGRLEFRHPLVREAAYRVPLAERVAAHAALAEVTRDEARRVWHRAAATPGHDEELAVELERRAELCRARGGRAAVAAAYERAAALSPDDRARGRRLAAAAVAAGDAGDIDRGITLAETAAGLVRDRAGRARIAEARADLEHTRGRPEAARALFVDAALAAPTPLRLVKAMMAAWDDADPAAAVTDTAARLGGLELAGPLARGAEGMRAHAVGELREGAVAIREFAEGVEATRDERCLADHVLLQGWDLLLGEYAAVHERVVRLDLECREQGAIGVLPRVLLREARCLMFLGRHHDAHATAMEGVAIARDTGCDHLTATFGGLLAALAALDGETVEEEAGVILITSAPWRGYAAGMLELGAGRFDAAAGRFAEVTGGPYRHTLIALHALPELVEAATRVGRHEEAAVAAARFAEWADATGARWAKAVELRCRALLSGEESLYVDAIAAHQGDGRPFELARTRLLYGEWLRRAKRRGDARTALSAALAGFERARPWAERARAELRAAGDTSEAPAPAPVARLTAQETQVVRLAATGMTNRDIGARLFLSPRTVGYHLSNAYAKLGVASRAALAGLNLAV